MTNSPDIVVDTLTAIRRERDYWRNETVKARRMGAVDKMTNTTDQRVNTIYKEVRDIKLGQAFFIDSVAGSVIVTTINGSTATTFRVIDPAALVDALTRWYEADAGFYGWLATEKAKWQAEALRDAAALLRDFHSEYAAASVLERTVEKPPC